MQESTQQSPIDFYGPAIYAYTRQDAVADGIQVKLDDGYATVAKRAGLRFPVYVTAGVWGMVDSRVEDGFEMAFAARVAINQHLKLHGEPGMYYPIPFSYLTRDMEGHKAQIALEHDDTGNAVFMVSLPGED